MICISAVKWRFLGDNLTCFLGYLRTWNYPIPRPHCIFKPRQRFLPQRFYVLKPNNDSHFRPIGCRSPILCAIPGREMCEAIV